MSEAVRTLQARQVRAGDQVQIEGDWRTVADVTDELPDETLVFVISTLWSGPNWYTVKRDARQFSSPGRRQWDDVVGRVADQHRLGA